MPTTTGSWRDSARTFIAERPAETRAYLAAFLPAAPTLNLRRVGTQIRVLWDRGEHPAFPSTRVEAQIARRGQSFAVVPIVSARTMRLPVAAANGVRVRMRTVNEVGTSPWSAVLRVRL